MPGDGLCSQCSDCREFSEQTIEAFTTKRLLDARLRFLPERPGTPERLLPFLGQTDLPRASIFAFFAANQVPLDEQFQVAGEGRPVHFHDLGQAVDRDRRCLGKGSGARISS